MVLLDRETRIKMKLNKTEIKILTNALSSPYVGPLLGTIVASSAASKTADSSRDLKAVRRLDSLGLIKGQFCKERLDGYTSGTTYVPSKHWIEYRGQILDIDNVRNILKNFK
jgi:hypothetical protein